MGKSSGYILKIARRTLDIESEAVNHLKELLNGDFVSIVRLIGASRGRVVVSGIGKSAIIAQKIVSTLNSTGTPSIFMHAADAIHGDLGIIQKDDIVICISKSGDTPEIKLLVPFLKSSGNRLIAMTANEKSFLGVSADFVLNTYVAKEACPNNLAPTSSSTAQMALGDALAVCLLEQRGFSKEDFAKFHPGGALGKRLYLKVSDLYPNNAAPQVSAGDDIRQVIVVITSNRLGAAAVIEKGKVSGIITDGDLRRMMLNRKSIDGISAKDIMSRKPKSASRDMMAVDALDLMKQHNISQLIVAERGRYYGMIHLHDLVKEGII